MDSAFIALGMAVLAILLWRRLLVPSRVPLQRKQFVLPADIILRAQPLLTDRALSLYNLMRLAVQDHYLVFAQVPLWAIVDVQGERRARSRVLKHIALKRLDFVLVHPGSKIVQQVVQLEEDPLTEADEDDRRETIQSVVQAAGITYRSLAHQTVYTVNQLTSLLGVGDDESA